MSEQIPRPCFCPVVHGNLRRAAFSGPQVSSNKWIYKADINASWRTGDLRTNTVPAQKKASAKEALAF